MAINYELLRVLAEKKVMPVVDWIRDMPAQGNPDTDYFDAAAIIHAGYAAVDTVASQGRPAGTLDEAIDDSAEQLFQMMMPKGTSFKNRDGLDRESWHGFGMRVHITAPGLLKLEERQEKKTDRRVAMWVGIVAAVVASLLTWLLTVMWMPSDPAQSDPPTAAASR